VDSYPSFIVDLDHNAKATMRPDAHKETVLKQH